MLPRQEVHYPDGKCERTFADGRRSVRFANGTRKEALSTHSGGGTVVFFVNGDMKRAFPSGGRIDYYYAEVRAPSRLTQIESGPGGLVREVGEKAGSRPL